MTLEHVYVIPHGDEIIERTSDGGNELFRRITGFGNRDSSETLVIISPHGLRIGGSVGIINTEYLKADLELKTTRISRTYHTDRETARQITTGDGFAREVTFITSSGPKSIFPLDFGSVIPLHFFGERNVVSIGQPRVWDKERLVKFGHDLSQVLKDSPRKISLIISADQAHTHSSSGPYGYAPESSTYEDLVDKCVRDSDLSPLLPLSSEFVDRAKPDSYWNMLILKGVMDNTGLKSFLDYHYVEEYFGMLLAHLE